MSEYNIHVSVEQRHIESGIRDVCESCPIANAINDCLKPEYRAAVGKEKGNVISIEYHDSFGRKLCHYMIKMDSKVIDFINRFDLGLKVEPFVFRLVGVPERMIKL